MCHRFHDATQIILYQNQFRGCDSPWHFELSYSGPLLYLPYYFHLQSKEMSSSLNCITYEGYSTHLVSHVLKIKREITAPLNVAHF